jgi:hypothetical protein
VAIMGGFRRTDGGEILAAVLLSQAITCSRAIPR